jgi:serine O-acetyltransferase
MFEKIIFYLKCWRLIPHLVIFCYYTDNELIYTDIKRWLQYYNLNLGKIKGFLFIMLHYPAFRNLFYYRVWFKRGLLHLLCPPMDALLVYPGKIGKGLFILNGTGSLFGPKSIGDNCTFGPQITIGYSNKTDHPTILNNVTVHAGATVIGNITIGNNAVIGTNALVIKDVPDNCTVVGCPAYVIKINGEKIKQT